MYDDVLGPLPDDDREVFLRSLIALVGGRLAQPSHVERPAPAAHRLTDRAPTDQFVPIVRSSDLG